MITQRYGDLEVAYTTQWHANTYPYFPAGVPAGDGQWRALGAVFANNASSTTWPGGEFGGLLVKDLSSGQDLLRPPVDFQKVGRFDPWTSRDADIWRPVPPAGYVALGDVVTMHTSAGAVKPRVSELGLVCVKQVHEGRAYVRRGELGRLPLRVNGSGRPSGPSRPRCSRRTTPRSICSCRPPPSAADPTRRTRRRP